MSKEKKLCRETRLVAKHKERMACLAFHEMSQQCRNMQKKSAKHTSSYRTCSIGYASPCVLIFFSTTRAAAACESVIVGRHFSHTKALVDGFKILLERSKHFWHEENKVYPGGSPQNLILSFMRLSMIYAIHDLLH